MRRRHAKGRMLKDGLTIQPMRSRLSAALTWTVLTVPGQTQNADTGPELEGMLTFETAQSGTLPAGWGGGPAGTVTVDDAIVHGGRWSARLERTAASPPAFSTLTKTIPVDFAGTTIEWSGFLRSETVSEFMGLWMRQDGDTPNLAFASMQPRQIRGTNDWTTCGCSWTASPCGRRRRCSGRRRRSISIASSTPAPASSSPS